MTDRNAQGELVPPVDQVDEDLDVRRVFIDETPATLQGTFVESVRAYWWLWISLVAIAFLSNWYAVLNAIDPIPLEYRVNPFPVMKREIKAGETLTTTTYRCNNLKVPLTYTNHRRWVRVDEEPGLSVVLIPDVTITAEPGCIRAFSRRNTVPPEVTAGVWIIEGEAVIRGRFRTFHVSYETDPFEVVP